MKNPLHSPLFRIFNLCVKLNTKAFVLLLFGALLFSNSSHAQLPLFDDFESGWGNWNDGGNDCVRNNNTLLGGNWNIRLRDNSGVASSMTSDPINFTSYGQINIRLNFYITGYENGENFFIQYSSGGGYADNLAVYTVGTNVNNNRYYTTTLTMTPADYTFGVNSRIRIRSNGSDNSDRVYIDNISIIGYPIPANDECSNAISLSTNTSCVTTDGTTLGATQSQSGCSGTADDDVWYSFVATNTEHTIRVAGSSLQDPVFQVFNGSCAGSSLVCEDSFGGTTPETSTLTGLTIGNTYFIRVYSYSSNVRTRGTFTICISEPCSPSSATGTTALACPSVDAGSVSASGLDPTIQCSDGGTELIANYLDLGETTSYEVQSIPYAPPFQFNCLANPVSVNIDDRWSDPISLPFDFCFYGSTYNSCVVGSNGVISFDTSLANGYSGWSISQNIPNINNASGRYYGPSIYGVHHDVDPSVGGEIGYQLITLDTGCQALVAAWSDVPMYQDNSLLYSGMIVFYEDTNVIEVYVKEKRIDVTWNGGNAAIGLQEDDTNGITAPGRNSLSGNWSANNEAWRFTPNGASITDLKWFEGSISAANEIIDPNDDGIITVDPASTISYFAEVTYTLCNGSTIIESDETIVTVEGNKTWNGSVSTAWENPNNWTPFGVPDATDCITIPNTANDPIMLGTTDGLGYNLSIEDGALLTQESNSSLTIEDDITIAVNGDLEIRDSANVIQIIDVATNKNSGSARVQRKVDGVNYLDYVYWSSPVDIFDVENISPSSPSAYIYNWESTIANGTAGQHGTWINTTENMTPGKGYIVRGLIGTTIANTAEFSGTINNGKISYPISRGSYTGADYMGIGNTATAEDDNWNLLGNPYPSAISLKDFVDANPAIDGTLYFWRHLNAASNAIDNPFYENFVYNYNDSDYIAANSFGSSPSGFNDYIASGQGFFALMLDSAVTPNAVIFDNTMRGVYANDGFYRNASNTQNKHRIWLDLVGENNTALSILVGFADGATDNMDRLYDGISINESNNQFYSVLSDHKLTIQAKALPFEDSKTIALGYKSSNAGSLSMTINQLDGLFEDSNQGIYLEDKELNIIHDLRANPYSFTTESGTFNERFVLRFNNTTLNIKDQDIRSNVIIRSLNNSIDATSSLSIIKTFEVFDITGRTIHKNINVNNSSYIFETNELSEGTYIVQVLLANGAIVSKKVII
jgi:hypothetical protein